MEAVTIAPQWAYLSHTDMPPLAVAAEISQ
jgi:hypothetical protein